MNYFRPMLALAITVSTLAACSNDSSGLNGEARVYMSASSATSANQIEMQMSANMMGGVPLSAVDSINIVLTSIQAVSTNDSAGGVTLSLQGAGSRSINLLKLSALGSDSTLLARGTLPAGTYNNIRLRFSSATITLKSAITVGTTSFPAGTYDLTIPSGLSSGIKVQGASFTVSADASTSATLSFDAASTVGTIVATGSNKLMMSPVIHVRTSVK